MPKRKAASSREVPKKTAKSDQKTLNDDMNPANLVKLGKTFFDQSCIDLSKALLGKIIVRKIENELIGARIVETEAYLGGEDKASHSYKGKTKRNTAMFMDPGTCYVYNIYGCYQCINISSQGEGAAVLIRAAEPVLGPETMTTLRSSGRQAPKSLKTKDLCNGPSKLCSSMNITKALFDQIDLVSCDDLYIADDGCTVGENEIVCKPRVGIAYAQEWTEKPFRFYIADNKCVSVK